MKHQTIVKSLIALWQQLISQIGNWCQLLFSTTTFNPQAVPVETKLLIQKRFLER